MSDKDRGNDEASSSQESGSSEEGIPGCSPEVVPNLEMAQADVQEETAALHHEEVTNKSPADAEEEIIVPNQHSEGHLHSEDGEPPEGDTGLDVVPKPDSEDDIGGVKDASVQEEKGTEAAPIPYVEVRADPAVGAEGPEVAADLEVEGSLDSGRDSPVPRAEKVTHDQVLEFANWPFSGPDDNGLTIQQAAATLLILQQNFEEDQLKAALQKLHRIVSSSNELMKFLEDKRAHRPVVGVMQHLQTYTGIQQVGCRILRHFAEESDILREHLISDNVHSFLIQVIRLNITDPDIQLSCMKIFAACLPYEKLCDQLLLDEQQEEVARLIDIAITAFRSVPEIQQAACSALYHLLKDDSGLHNRFVGESLLILLEVLKSTSDIRLHQQIIRICCVVAETGNHLWELLESDLHFVAMEECTQRPGEEDLMTDVLELLAYLIKGESVQEILVSSGFVLTGLATILSLSKRSANLQVSGLKIINVLAQQLMEDRKADEISQVLLSIIKMAMSTHFDRPDVQIEGCWALCNILEHRPEAHRWIGEIAEDKQEPLHNQCLGAILVNRRNVKVFVAACDGIYWIAADNERLCNYVMSKNAHVAILDGLKRHRKTGQAVELGCRALRGICIFNEGHKRTLVKDGAFSVLTMLQKKYMEDPAVQTEIIGAIACLADVNIVRYQAFVEKVPEMIIQVMKDFPFDHMIQEVGLEAFAVLALADNGSEMQIKAGALRVTIEALKTHPKDLFIQKKGLIVLGLFATHCEAVPTSDLYMGRDTAVVVSAAMRNFPQSSAVLSEACVALQLFAESVKEMSHQFVHECCHEHLFRILEMADSEKLQHLASECLFVLSIEQNLKSNMLLSACKNGVLAGTECLIELGADVNIGHVEDTPLYHAVANQEEDMVRLLLKQEIHDLIGPLKKSLQLENKMIMGLILQQYGYDRDSGYITWSDLKLTKLEPDWLRIALLSRPSADTEQDSGRLIVNKIKESEHKRNERQKIPRNKSEPLLGRQSVGMRMSSRSSITEEDTKDFEHQIKSPPAEKAREAFFPPSTLKIQPEKINRSERGSVSEPKMKPLSPITPENPAEADDDSRPVFDLTSTEAEEWKETTLTGATVPYSPLDPRQRTPSASVETIEGSWKRKKSRSPRGSLQSSSSFSSYSPVLGGSRVDKRSLARKRNSAPVLPNLSHLAAILPRKMSVGSLQDLNSTKHLYSLDVSANLIPDLSSLAASGEALLQQFSHLQKLYLCGNKLKSIPGSLFEYLPQLLIVDARMNELTEFPAAALKCTKLTELILSKNNITELQVLQVNPSLKRLDLSHNDLKTFPKGIGNCLPKLVELQLNNNDLTGLQDSALGLKDLLRLDVSHNTIGQIPEDFLQMCNSLELVDASFNNLDSLPSPLAAMALTKLSKIKLRKNLLAEKEPFYIPKFVLNLPSVRTIDLSENGLKGLPSLNLWKSKVIKEFVVSKNKIDKLPLEGAKVWSKMEKLHLAHNRVSEIPKEIGQLTCLTSFDISHNSITTLPDELGRCSRMWEMPTEGLDLDLDKGLLRRRVKDIISYLHNRLKNAQRYYRMKLMVVGYGGRGKTTLLQTLMKRGARKKKENKPTVGVIVDDWKYQRQERRANSDHGKSWSWRSGQNIEFTLNTWDFAGQEDFYSTHQCYLSNRAIYLVVFDLRHSVSDIEQLKPWLASIHSRAPGCPVIVVGTHLDKLSHDPERFATETNRISERLRDFNTTPGFPTIHAASLVDGSCENENVEQLRNIIKSVVDEFQIRGKHVMGEKIPASYVKLADMLTEEAKSLQTTYPVIQQRRLQQIVESANLDLDDEELEQAIRFLHDSGVLLHYEDSALHLRDFYFIDPGWLCRMMAQIITVRQINPFISKDGIMRKKDVHLLFRDKHFPASLLEQYLNLLQKFEIALPHSETEVLIPCRLPLPKPDIHLPVQHKHEKICRIYRMPYVPLGLWFRLISRMISLTSSANFKTLLRLTECPRKVCWRKGMYIFWSEHEFFLLDSLETDEGILITVPATAQGSRLLGHIVDHIDGLIDEWYPGLTSIDPMLGQEVLERLVVCPHCPDDTDYHTFPLKELELQTERSDQILCPKHNGNVSLSSLAPDLVMSDLEVTFHLDEDNFEFEARSEKQLGDGGFGDVYQGTYKGKEVAVKLFKRIADVHPLKMLRQEATILRCLKHPSIVSLIAVGIRPPVLVLELAPHGTLGGLVKSNRRMATDLQHRIALQVAEGLKYLHGMLIVFRDMKPDNVLIFNLSLKASVNVKISDYGIARFAASEGLKAQEGTLAYRAPEVIRKECYSFQADVFSYGLTMYVMLTRGRHPFDHLESKGEMDRAISEHVGIQPMITKGAPAWPDMHALVLQCLEFHPDSRPTASDIWQRLRSAELLCLQRIIPVSLKTTVECFAVQETDQRELCLWSASGDLASFQLSQINLTNSNKKTEGSIFKYGRILCLHAIGASHLILGTQLGKVWVFDAVNNKVIHSSAQLPDSVLCLKFIKGDTEGGMLLAGLGNGKLAIFLVTELLNEKDVDPFCLGPGYDHEPVCCLEKYGQHVFVSCGTRIVILGNSTAPSRKGPPLTFEKFIDTSPDRSAASPPINTLTAIKGSIIFSKKFSPKLEIWDAWGEKVKKTINIAEMLGTDNVHDRVTAIVIQDGKFLWVGTHCGHIAVLNVKSFELLVKSHRYHRTVRSLVYVRHPGLAQYRGVFSGGLGFRENPDDDMDADNLNGCVAIWDWNYAHHANVFMEYEKERYHLQCRSEPAAAHSVRVRTGSRQDSEQKRQILLFPTRIS